VSLGVPNTYHRSYKLAWLIETNIVTLSIT
jgi:hypothetical protein